MCTAALHALLADMPPHLWAETRRRVAVVERYLETKRPTQKDVDGAVAQLGLTRRSFYKLVRLVTQARAGILPPPSRQGRHQHISPAAERIISQVLEDLGDRATLSEVYVEAKRLSEANNSPAPSLQAVRGRFGEPPRLPRLKTRLRTEADLVVDSSALSIDVAVSDVASEPAFLTAVFDADNGMVLAHGITGGAPTALAVLGILASTRTEGAGPNQRSLVATRHIASSVRKSSELLTELGLDLDESAPAIASGAALLRVFGLRVGRIPLLPRGRRPGKAGTATDALPISDVQIIVATLVAKRNAELQEAMAQGLPSQASGEN